MSTDATTPSRSAPPREGADSPPCVPPPYSSAGHGEGLQLRSALDCWACAVLISTHNLLVTLLNLLLMAAVVGAVLLPAATMVTFGLLCHSQVLDSPVGRCKDMLKDGGSTALMVLGSVLAIPLAVLALAAYCRFTRHLQLGLCFVPYSKAVYRNLPATHYWGSSICCLKAGEAEGKVWV